MPVFPQDIFHTIKRYRSLYTHTISALPIVILMPHSACNCRCVMCDIWKGNKNLKQLTENDIKDLLTSLKKLQTKQVVMSGGEALLNNNFFSLCRILKQQGLHITLLSTGLLLKKYAAETVQYVDDVIVSLDGDETTHDKIRNIPGCYLLLKEGIKAIRSIAPHYKITGRTVIHKLNFAVWPNIVEAAKESGLDQISFLPADVSSSAFNREERWDIPRQNEVMPGKAELPVLKEVLQLLIRDHQEDFEQGFIAESPEKLWKIYTYYTALHGLNEFPVKKCNAPWVSAVIEADGNVRPCFFHDTIGNIRENQLDTLINSAASIAFRKNLDTEKDSICKKCVCYLNLPPRINPASL
jgi:MoaA/NifB/PqqE/SkfB family radical SAM enzyme